jgi:glycosyltransferase A (GT-A) superfamily protein (DUF2064 family)
MMTQQRNALLVFAREPSIKRGSLNEPFVALTWEDLNQLFTALLADIVESAFHLGNTDVLFYRNLSTIPDELLRPYRKRLQSFHVYEANPAVQIQHAIEHAFAQQYQRVIVVLENHPVLRPAFLSRMFEQLDYEDDCVVVGPAEEGKCVFLGMKANHSALFDATGSDPVARPSALMQRLCAVNTMLFLARPGYVLDSDVNLFRLKQELDAGARGGEGFPRRTYQVFKSFERKYKRAKRVYWRKGRL